MDAAGCRIAGIVGAGVVVVTDQGRSDAATDFRVASFQAVADIAVVADERWSAQANPAGAGVIRGAGVAVVAGGGVVDMGADACDAIVIGADIAVVTVRGA